MKKLVILLSILSIVCCNDIENCDANDNRDFMILRFYDIETKSEKKVGFQVTSGDFIYGEGFYFEDSTAIGLPLNPNSETITFLFDSIYTSMSYEIEMSYKTQLSIFDPDCNPFFIYSNIDTIRYTFDSLSIPGTITNRQLNTNVEIYF